MYLKKKHKKIRTIVHGLDSSYRRMHHALSWSTVWVTLHAFHRHTWQQIWHKEKPEYIILFALSGFISHLLARPFVLLFIASVQ